METCEALYRKRLFAEAREAAQSALRAIPPPSKEIRLKLREVERACDLNKALAGGESDPSQDLRGGWYERRLRHLVDSGALDAISPGEAGLRDCVIVLRASGETGAWDVWYSMPHGIACNTPGSILRGFPCDQMTGGRVYLKDHGVVRLGCDCYESGGPCRRCISSDYPLPVYRFPEWALSRPLGTMSKQDPGLDVHYVNGAVPEEIRSMLINKLGQIKVVRPAPFYENRIDPNIGAFDAGDGAVWVPVGIDISNVRIVEVTAIMEAAAMRDTGQQLPSDVNRRVFSFCDVTDSRWPAGRSTIRSRIPDVDPHAHSRLYWLVEEVLDAALPLLAALRLPSLLLPGPLQVVVKAQSIVLKEGERYEGVWHEDGLREDVVAVVLYYYNVSPSLSGGAIEFATKQRVPLGWGDHKARYTLDAEGARDALQELPRCIVPVESGSLVVFSNYPCVHRVLPIEALAEGGSRDFLALFVIDQKAPLATPHDLGPQNVRLARRAELLGEQLRTRVFFGVDGSQVYTTGNGLYSDIAWLSKAPQDWCVNPGKIDAVNSASSVVSQVNMAPPVVGRGSSYLAQLQVSCEYNPESTWVQYVIGPPQTALILFVDTWTFEYHESAPTDHGIHEVRLVDSFQEFVDQGFWTDDESLSTRLDAMLAQQT